MRQMREWSGFFPAAPEYLARFCELMLRDMEELDILGSWLPYEWEVMPMIHGVPRVRLLNLEPYWSSRSMEQGPGREKSAGGPSFCGKHHAAV